MGVRQYEDAVVRVAARSAIEHTLETLPEDKRVELLLELLVARGYRLDMPEEARPVPPPQQAAPSRKKLAPKPTQRAAVLQLLRQRGGLTAVELALALKLEVDAVRSVLHKLKARDLVSSRKNGATLGWYVTPEPYKAPPNPTDA